MRVRLDQTDTTFLLSTGTQETCETHLFERVETLHFCGSGIFLTLQVTGYFTGWCTVCHRKSTTGTH